MVSGTGLKGDERRLFFVGFVLLAATLAFFRWHWSVVGVEDRDAALFLAGARDFDPRDLRPHWPGYPLLLLLVRGLMSLGAKPEGAFQLCSLMGWLLAALATGALLKPHLGTSKALLAALFMLCHPLALLEGGRVASDSAGLGVLLAAWALLENGARRWAAWLLGLSLGVRAGYLLVVLPLLWRAARGRGRWVLPCFLLGVGVWALPLTLALGFGETARGLLAFWGGHVERFGGTAFGGPSGLHRLYLFARDLGAWFPGGLWPGLPLVFSLFGALCLFLLWRARRVPPPLPWWLLFLPYALFVALFQNPSRPRHLLPFLPWCGAGLVLGLGTLRSRSRRYWLGGVLFALLIFSSLLLMSRQHSRPPPLQETVAWCRRHVDPLRARLYAGAEADALSLLLPELDVRLAGGLKEIELDLQGDPAPADKIFVLDSVLRNAASPGKLVLLHRASSSWFLFPSLPEISIHELKR